MGPKGCATGWGALGTLKLRPIDIIHANPPPAARGRGLNRHVGHVMSALEADGRGAAGDTRAAAVQQLSGSYAIIETGEARCLCSENRDSLNTRVCCMRCSLLLKWNLDITTANLAKSLNLLRRHPHSAVVKQLGTRQI